MLIWAECELVNQYFIPELKGCKDKPYLITYETIKGRRYVAKINIKNGRLQSKLPGTSAYKIVAYMPCPEPYRGDLDE